MRPHKHVLLFSSDQDRLRELRFVLRTWLYDVSTDIADTVPDMALLVHDSRHEAETFAAQVNTQFRGEVPMVVLMKPSDKPFCSYEGPWLMCSVDTSTADLLARVKAVAARKRGPKPVRYGAKVAKQETVMA